MYGSNNDQSKGRSRRPNGDRLWYQSERRQNEVGPPGQATDAPGNQPKSTDRWARTVAVPSSAMIRRLPDFRQNGNTKNKRERPEYKCEPGPDSSRENHAGNYSVRAF